ncbi:hypothetical protein ACWEQ4_01110 [Rhodococcus sp. NPDC003994]
MTESQRDADNIFAIGAALTCIAAALRSWDLVAWPWFAVSLPLLVGITILIAEALSTRPVERLTDP